MILHTKSDTIIIISASDYGGDIMKYNISIFHITLKYKMFLCFEECLAPRPSDKRFKRCVYVFGGS